MYRDACAYSNILQLILGIFNTNISMFRNLKTFAEGIMASKAYFDRIKNVKNRFLTLCVCLYVCMEDSIINILNVTYFKIDNIKLPKSFFEPEI